MINFNDSTNTIEIVAVIIGAVLAYGFGRFQHNKEYKEDLRYKIFGCLLSVDLPYAYTEFMNNPKSNEKYNVFSNKLKELVKKCSVLKLKNQKKYMQIRELVLCIDELSGFNEYHLVNGVETPKEITELHAIVNRKREIDGKFKKLYRIIGTDNYKNVIYVGYTRNFFQFIYDFIFNRYKNN